MSNTSLLLGPILFQDFEIPCGINFGGTQRLAVHQLPGGVRVIDALGRDDADIRFSGIFSGDDATLRARLLDELRASGLPLPLTWDVFFYTVVISDFQADYTTKNWIFYTVTCKVIRDEASALIGAALSLGTALLADVGTAIGQALPGGIDISSIQSVVSDPSATVRDTAAYSVAQSGLSGAQSNLALAVSGAQTALPYNTLTSPGTAAGGIGALATAVTASQQLGQLSVAQAYLGRASINLANAST